MMKKPILNVHAGHDASEETNDMQSTHLDGARMRDPHPKGGGPSKVSHAAAGPNRPMIADGTELRKHTEQLDSMGDVEFAANNSRSQQFAPGQVQDPNARILLSKSLHSHTPAPEDATREILDQSTR